MPAEAVQAIVEAFSAGAVVAASGVGYAAVQDAYAGLKAAIVSKFTPANIVDLLENNPAREGRKQTLAEELEATGAAKDAEVLRLTKRLEEALLEAQPYDDAGNYLIDLKNIEAGHSIILKNLKAIGGGIRVSGIKGKGNFEMHDATATAPGLAENQAGN